MCEAGQNFFIFWNILSYGIWHDRTLNKDPLLVILVSGTNFWVGQEVDGWGRSIFFFFEIFFPWTFQWYMTPPYAMNNLFWAIFGHGGKWVEQVKIFICLSSLSKKAEQMNGLTDTWDSIQLKMRKCNLKFSI